MRRLAYVKKLPSGREKPVTPDSLVPNRSILTQPFLIFSARYISWFHGLEEVQLLEKQGIVQ
ncbi:hypothetical protein YTPLAS72_32510 [Nitrospira sp.]|nr:hypothetical protein YTPLAS72_32510 [Nitrospira sp.]